MRRQMVTTMYSNYANQTHFHKKGFARRLVLKQRHKVNRECPIVQLPTYVFLSYLSVVMKVKSFPKNLHLGNTFYNRSA